MTDSETVVFKTRGPRQIYVHRLGTRIRFDSNGEYATSDPAEIAVLARHRNVTSDNITIEVEPEPVLTHKEKGSEGTPKVEHKEEPKPKVTPQSIKEAASKQGVTIPGVTTEAPVVNDDPPADKPLDHTEFTRPELNRIAMDEDIDPEMFMNKKALADEINAGRAKRLAESSE